MSELKIRASVKAISKMSDKIGMSFSECQYCGIREFCENNKEICVCNDTWYTYIVSKCEKIDGLEYISERSIKDIANSIGNAPSCNICQIKEYCSKMQYDTCVNTWANYIFCMFLLWE